MNGSHGCKRLQLRNLVLALAAFGAFSFAACGPVASVPAEAAPVVQAVAENKSNESPPETTAGQPAAVTQADFVAAVPGDTAARVADSREDSRRRCGNSFRRNCRRRRADAHWPPTGNARPHLFPTESARSLARRRRRLDQHRRPDRSERLARQVRAARFLVLLLHQLHAHHAGAEKARTCVSEQSGRDRRSHGEIRGRARFAKHHRRGDALRDRASRGQRRAASDLESLQGQ